MVVIAIVILMRQIRQITHVGIVMKIKNLVENMMFDSKQIFFKKRYLTNQSSSPYHYLTRHYYVLQKDDTHKYGCGKIKKE